MHPRDRLLLLTCTLMCVFASLPIWADSGDVEGSHDYPGWTRMPGFEITDYDEDNPAEYTFSVSRPQAADANHLEAIPVEGHRYVLRYEWNDSATPPSLLKTQRYYEKLAAAQGYVVEKSGATGNVTETFHLENQGRQVWVFLNPSVRVNMLTIVESRTANSPTLAAPSPPPSIPPPPPVITPAPKVDVVSSPISAPGATSATALILPPVPASAPSRAPAPTIVSTPAPAPNPIPTPTSEPNAPSSPAEDPLATALMQDGRIVLPVSFLPGKPDLDDDSKPAIDRVIAILKRHPDLEVTIEGHTDLTGDEDYNMLLSKQRAQTVRTLLIAGHINRHRLTAVGLGGSQPVADEGTAVGREKNRRIELVLKSGSMKSTSQKESARGDASAPIEPGGNSSFHAPAPDGVNYYPKSASAPPNPPAGLSR